jgi:hypothetical protein
MVKHRRLHWLILLSSILLIASCSSGEDTDTAPGGEKPSENNTVWGQLIWDDGSGQNTMKWAD